MVRVIIRIDKDQIIMIGKYHLEVEICKDKIIEDGHNMLIIIEIT